MFFAFYNILIQSYALQADIGYMELKYPGNFNFQTLLSCLMASSDAVVYLLSIHIAGFLPGYGLRPSMFANPL